MGTQFPLRPNEANTGSREKWRGNRSRGLRTAPGTRLRRRTTRKAACPPPSLHSDLVSPQPRAPGLTHLTAPPTTAGRPASTTLTSSGPPRKRFMQLRTELPPRPAPHALGTRAPTGRGGGRPHVRSPGKGHTHPRDHSSSSPSPGEKLSLKIAKS